MRFSTSALALATASVATASQVVSYDGHHVYRILADGPQEVEEIEARFAHFPSVHGRDALEVVVPPHEVRAFEESGLNARLLSDDLGAQIRAEDVPSTYRRGLNKRDNGLPDLSWFDTYHPYDDHLDWWDDVAAAFPNSEKISVGSSYEGRDLFAFHFWGDEGKSEDKPIIYWHGTVHAREWISTMVVEYLTYQLVDGYTSGDQNITAFLNHYDFWIVPFHNPDGMLSFVPFSLVCLSLLLIHRQASSTLKPQTVCGARTANLAPTPLVSVPT
jgi:hypothetical protein